MQWDTTLSVEGVATAAGVVGAAAGYLVNLVKNWRQQAKDRRRRGTYSVILHLLEEDLVHGLTEDQLWEKYHAADSLQIRTRYDAIAPERLDRVYFEALIRDLRLDRLIEIVGRDQYRLETRHLDAYDLRTEAEGLAKDAVRRLLAPRAVADRALAWVRDSTIASWEREKALRLLVRVAPEEGVQEANALLESDDREASVMAGEVLAELQASARPLRTSVADPAGAAS